MEPTKENLTSVPLETLSENQSVIIETDGNVNNADAKAESEFFEFNEVDTAEHEHYDYSTFDKKQIVEHLEGLVLSGKIGDIKEDVEDLRSCFYKIHRTEVDKIKQKFIEDGGAEEDFKFEDVLEVRFKELYKRFKDQKNQFNESIEKEKLQNLVKRKALIEELKELINRKESVATTFKEFRDIQTRWKSLGMVPLQENKNIWESYHHHVGMFYDFVKINNELRDLDLKKNLEIKIEICEKAEKLLLEDSVVKAFAELQKLHEQWREVGPVSVDKKTEVWERFKSVTTQINKRHQDYFTNLKEQEKNNLDAKTHICEKIEEIVASQLTTAKDWTEKSNEIIELQKMWRTIGFAPKKYNNEIYLRFRQSCNEFFNKKRDFFSTIKDEEEHNKQIKINLCLQAEALQNSTDWKRTSADLISLQKEWKDSGVVARKDSEKLWKRFRAACDVFFNAKAQYYKSLETEQEENLKKKLSIIEKVESLNLNDNQEQNLEVLQTIQKEWSEIGLIPFEQKEKIQSKFREAINKKFESLSIDDEKKKFLKYRVKIESNSISRNADDKMSFERTKLYKKTKELQDEIALLENNIGFFSKSKNAESIINDQKNKIEKLKHELDVIHKQVKMLDEVENHEKK